MNFPAHRPSLLPRWATGARYLLSALHWRASLWTSGGARLPFSILDLRGAPASLPDTARTRNRAVVARQYPGRVGCVQLSQPARLFEQGTV